MNVGSIVCSTWVIVVTYEKCILELLRWTTATCQVIWYFKQYQLFCSHWAFHSDFKQCKPVMVTKTFFSKSSQVFQARSPVLWTCILVYSVWLYRQKYRLTNRHAHMHTHTSTLEILQRVKHTCTSSCLQTEIQEYHPLSKVHKRAQKHTLNKEHRNNALHTHIHLKKTTTHTNVHKQTNTL